MKLVLRRLPLAQVACQVDLGPDDRIVGVEELVNNMLNLIVMGPDEAERRPYDVVHFAVDSPLDVPDDTLHCEMAGIYKQDGYRLRAVGVLRRSMAIPPLGGVDLLEPKAPATGAKETPTGAPLPSEGAGATVKERLVELLEQNPGIWYAPLDLVELLAVRNVGVVNLMIKQLGDKVRVDEKGRVSAFSADLL